MDDGRFGTLAEILALGFQERRAFEISYALGKGLVSSPNKPEIARTRPNNTENQGLVAG